MTDEFSDLLVNFDENDWLAVKEEIKKLGKISADEQEQLLSYLKLVATSYFLHAAGEAKGKQHRELAIASHKTLKDAVAKASDLLALFQIPVVHQALGGDSSNILVKNLKSFIEAAEASLPTIEPGSVPRGGKVQVAVFRLAITFEHLWRFFYQSELTSAGHSLAEAFFFAAGYHPKDKRSSGRPDDIGKMFREAKRLRDSDKDPFVSQWLKQPFITIAR